MQILLIYLHQIFVCHVLDQFLSVDICNAELILCHTVKSQLIA